ncbi:hypothetical protein [Rhizobacter fulvus]
MTPARESDMQRFQAWAAANGHAFQPTQGGVPLPAGSALAALFATWRTQHSSTRTERFRVV